MRALGVALVVAVVLGITTARPLVERPPSTADSTAPVLLINQRSSSFSAASEVRGQQVLMLLRHFSPAAVLVRDVDYRSGMEAGYDRVVVMGNDALQPMDPRVLADIRARSEPTLWIGYGIADLSPDLDRDLGFAPGFVVSSTASVDLTYRGRSYPTAIQDYHEVRIARPDVQVVASLRDGTHEVPLAVHRGHFWFFGTLPGFETDYPDAAVDVPDLVFADLLHDFFGRAEHEPARAIIRLEDVSAHIPPNRIIDVTDVLAARRIPFVIGVIPAQRLADGSVLSLADRPGFVQALRYAQDRGGTIALHGYHHTFGEGEDYEFWDAARGAPLTAERWETDALKVEDGIRTLRDQGLEPRLWETPHYAASALGYAVFGSYFSHAIEDRDPFAWLPYPAGPDPAGQVLIPENIGYLNESAGLTVDAMLARADLLRIVRDATAVGFYHPATIPIDDLERLVDGLTALGYRFADVRSFPLRVADGYRPSVSTTATTFLRVEPGLTLLELQRAVLGDASPVAGLEGGAVLLGLAGLAVGLFLVRLRAQWRPAVAARSRVEPDPSGPSGRIAARLVLVGGVVVMLAGMARLTVLGPVAPTAVPPVRDVAAAAPETPASASDGWTISAYFTAVERFYSGPRVTLRGCPVLDCVNGTAILGRFPRDFLTAVKEEGSGRLASPVDGSAYLNWSIDVGYWLDTAPRDARGSALEPYVSAAADPAVAYVSTFRVDRCGTDTRTGEAVDPRVCVAIRAATWIVRDRFTQGAVGKRLDLYIGEQDTADFLALSPRAIDTHGAAITLRPYDSGRWGT